LAILVSIILVAGLASTAALNALMEVEALAGSIILRISERTDLQEITGSVNLLKSQTRARI
jgi:hypothetical protein